MTRRLAVAAALGVAALAFAADDPNAPLANTKAQLQSLKKDEAAQKADTQGATKFDLPTLNPPGQELELPRPKREDTDTKEKKRAGRKDWLLEGFDKLDRKKSAASSPKRADGKTEDAPLDPNDPDYFLRVYERQRAERDAKQLDVNAPNASEVKTSGAPDPFAPFMKEWLANSPVREALKEGSGHDTASDSTLSPIGVGESSTTSGTDGSSTAASSNAPRVSATNPFIQSLGAPLIDSPKPTEARAPVVDVSNAPPPPAGTPGNTIYDLPERPKTDVKHALPPPPSEDRKYFPQLKKF